MRRRLVLESTGAATLTLLSSVAAFACDVDPRFADEIANQIPYAFILYCVGIGILFVHVVVFFYRAVRGKSKSHAVFWSTLLLSTVFIPIITLFLAIANQCGDIGHGFSFFLIGFETLCVTAQVLMWQIDDRLTTSVIPLSD